MGLGSPPTFGKKKQAENAERRKKEKKKRDEAKQKRRRKRIKEEEKKKKDTAALSSLFEEKLKADGNVIDAGLANDQGFINFCVSEMTKVYVRNNTNVDAEICEKFWKESSQWLGKQIENPQTQTIANNESKPKPKYFRPTDTDSWD